MTTKKPVPDVQMLNIDAIEPADARVLIAQDVLALLDAEAIHLGKGTYIEEYGPSGSDPNTLMHTVVAEWLSQGSCRVCAIGATLLAAVRRFDDLRVTPFLEVGVQAECREPMIEYLSRFFEREQLDLIEIAFEESTRILGLDPDTIESGRLAAAQSFRKYHAVYGGAETLRLIFTNIISNGGTFIP